MFPHTVESGCHIDINFSEQKVIHACNGGKSAAHPQNIILILIRLGFFDMFRLGEGSIPSIFVVSEPIRTKFCTAIDHQSVGLNMNKIA